MLDGIDASDEDLAQKGYVSQPIGKQPGKPDPTHGGVQLMVGEKKGCIRRDATLGLAALRRLCVLEANGTLSTDRTDALRRYILGLALVALTATQETYLRQGCNLVPADEGKTRTFKIVHSTGKCDPFMLMHLDAKNFAEVAARAFEVGRKRDVDFDKKLAEKDIKGDDAGANTQKLEGGEVVTIDAQAKKFTLKILMDGNEQQIEVTTNDDTKFKKGRSNKTFTGLVVVGAKLDLEVTNGIAVKVTAKN